NGEWHRHGLEHSPLAFRKSRTPVKTGVVAGSPHDDPSSHLYEPCQYGQLSRGDRRVPRPPRSGTRYRSAPPTKPAQVRFRIEHRTTIERQRPPVLPVRVE